MGESLVGWSSFRRNSKKAAECDCKVKEQAEFEITNSSCQSFFFFLKGRVNFRLTSWAGASAEAAESVMFFSCLQQHWRLLAQVFNKVMIISCGGFFCSVCPKHRRKAHHWCFTPSDEGLTALHRKKKNKHSSSLLGYTHGPSPAKASRVWIKHEWENQSRK